MITTKIKEVNENETLKENYRFARKIHCAFLEFCIENYSIQEPTTLINFKDCEYLKYKYHNNAGEYIENELGISSYICGKDGGEFPLYECPECGEEQLVYDGEKEEYCCFSCNSIYAESKLSKCCECGDFMVNKESLICEDCWNKKMKE